MKKTEIILILLLAFFDILRYFEIPGALFASWIVFFLLVAFYLLFTLFITNNIPIKEIFRKSSYKNIKLFRIICCIVLGYSLSVTIASIQFSVHQYPGAKGMLFSSLSSLLWCIVLIVLEHIFYKSTFYQPAFWRIIFWGSLAMITYFSRHSESLLYKF